MDSGEIGSPLLMYSGHRNPEVPAHYTREMAITDTAVHDIDTARWLLGEEIVAAQVLKPRKNSLGGDLEDPLLTILETAGGALIQIETNVNIRYGYDIRGEIVGEQGTVSLAESTPVIVRRGGSFSGRVTQDWRERFIIAYDIEFAEWLDAIASGGEFGPSSWDGYAAAVGLRRRRAGPAQRSAGRRDDARQAGPIRRALADTDQPTTTINKHIRQGNHGNDPADGGASGGALPVPAVQRTRRGAAAADPGCFGIFGHGNVAGVGQALLQAATTGEADLPYYLARNEQGMVHAAAGFAKASNRLQVLACTASIGPGSANMLTGAALATTNRLPVLLLPSDIFATRAASPVLQELELPSGYDISVNDAFRPLSRFFDRVWRPEQLPAALLGAMRVLTDPTEAGAVTIALPQDVQAEAHDWPEELFAERVWHIARPVPERAALTRAVDAIRSAKRPLIVAGGGVIYSEATERCAGSPRPPASRSPTRRPARAPCPGTTRRPSVASGRPAPRWPTHWASNT